MCKSIFLFVFVLMLSAWSPIAYGAQPVSKVIATVNGAELTEADLNQEINILMPMNQSFHGKISDEKIKKISSEALKNLVDSELSAQDATAKGIKISATTLEDEYQKMVVKYNSKKELEAAYQKAGFTEVGFKRIIERKLLAEKNRLIEVDNAVSISPEKVKDYYNKNITRYSKPEEFRASQILVKVDPTSNKVEKAALAARAEKLLKRIRAGENFEEIAENESDDPSRVKGGDLGYFHAGQTIAEFEQSLLKLKVGEISDIVETLYGFHIIRLTEKRAPRLIPFEEIQEKLKKDLVNSEKKSLRESWMGRLYKNAKISYQEMK